MYFIICCTEWLQLKRFEGTMEEAITEIERLSNFHGASFELLNEKQTPIGMTQVPEPTYVFKVRTFWS